MFSYPYAKPSVTVTVFAFYNGMLVVGTRSKTTEAYPGFKCVPGGFLEAYYEVGGEVINPGETTEQAVIREFEEECGVTLDEEQIILFHNHSDPHTDPRCHVVNLCYIVHLRKDQLERLQPGDDLEALDLVPISEINKSRISNEEGWAFNHLHLAHMAIFLLMTGGDYFRGTGSWSS